MKKNLSLVLFASLAVGLQAAVVSAPVAHPASSFGQVIDINVIDNGTGARVDRDEAYDFESGEQGWTSHGTGLTNDTWHVEPTSFGGAHTDTWWSADAGVGGYLSSSFVYLQTTSFDLSAATAPTLSFDLYYAAEAPGGEPAGYDGWDTANVWASIDGGDTWSVISGSPAYNITSSFAFGDEFGMGTGIPGWGGTAAGWAPASFDLSALNGQSDVMLRFVMCADPAQDYTDDNTLIGMQIDNIVVADGGNLWANDGAGDGTTSGYYVYGDEWAYTGHEWRCTNGVSLGCWIESDWITFTPPALFQLEQDIRCDLPDSDGNDDGFLEDYFHIEYTSNGTDWIQLTYDYAGDTRPAWMDAYYTYTNADVFTGSLSFTLPSATHVKLRYRITTDGDNDGGDGSGLWVDNVNLSVASVPAHDIAMSKAWIDYPRTAGEFQYPKLEIANLGASDETNIRGNWRVYADSVGGALVHNPTPVNLTATAITALDSVRVEMAANAPASWKWAPSVPGNYVIQFYTNLVTDLDRSNDTLEIAFTAYEDNFGLLRYDYDTSTAWTLAAGTGRAALVRFDPIAEPWTAQYFAATLYNVVAGDEVHIVIHDEGPDAQTAGPLLAEYVTTVTGPEEVYPNNLFRYIGNAPELRCIDHPIWIGVRNNPNNVTGIVGLSGDNGGPYWEQHSFDYDYTDDSTAPWDGDVRVWMQVDWGVESELPFAVELTGELVSNTYTLSWNSPGPVDGYLVYRSANGYDFSGAPVADLDKDTRTYTDTVVGGQLWFYKVVGYNGLCTVPAE